VTSEASAAGSKKPFYFQPPWNILFELNRLRNLHPWDVDIAFLLTSFLKEMNRRGEVDFRASGVALDSSSVIYLMKSKLLLELEKPPAPPKAAADFLPPPLFLPVRYELTSTTVQELLKVLDEVLKGEHLLALKPRTEPILPPPEILPPLDLYLVEIEKQMERLCQKLARLAEQGKFVLFSKVITGLERLEAIKIFIVMLFLAQKGEITLWQNEELTEIYIVLKGGLSADAKPPIGVV
jgi:chromatin segregation and condensation protein Rec8/ScpA/Scc1 (kleisin family)